MAHLCGAGLQKQRTLLSHSCTSHVSSWHQSIFLPQRRCNIVRLLWVHLPLLRSMSFLTCLLPLRASQGHEDRWVTPTKEPFKPPVRNMPVCLSDCRLHVSLPTCLSSSSCSPSPAFVCVCQPSPCSTNYMSPCLLTCLTVCHCIHMLSHVLSQQLDSIPTTAWRIVLALKYSYPTPQPVMLWPAAYHTVISSS